MDDVVSGVFHGHGNTKEVCYCRKDVITRSSPLDDAGCLFEIIGLFRILFDLILSSHIMGNNTALSIIYRSCVDI